MFGVGGANTNSTIKDDLTSSTVNDATLAMYTLGEIVVSGSGPTTIGYSLVRLPPLDRLVLLALCTAVRVRAVHVRQPYTSAVGTKDG